MSVGDTLTQAARARSTVLLFIHATRRDLSTPTSQRSGLEFPTKQARNNSNNHHHQMNPTDILSVNS